MAEMFPSDEFPDPAPTCGGRRMDRAATSRKWECPCGRYVTDEFISDSAVKVMSFPHVAASIAVAVDRDVGSCRGSWREPWVGSLTRPTDTRIVEAWQEARIRDRVYGHVSDDAAGYMITAVMVDGHPVTRAEFQAAWSRVLAAKVAASDAVRAEADRRVVLGPIDDESET